MTKKEIKKAAEKKAKPPKKAITKTRKLSMSEVAKIIKSKDDKKSLTFVLDKLLLKGTSMEELLEVGQRESKARGQKQFQTAGSISALIQHRRLVCGWQFDTDNDGKIKLVVK